MIEKYLNNNIDTTNTNIKSDTILENASYILNEFNGITKTIFHYNEDNRRGIWINVVHHNSIPLLVQLQAGREGDDDIITYVLNDKIFKEYLDIDYDGNKYILNEYNNYDFILTTIDKINLDFNFYYDFNLKESLEKKERER